MKTITLMTLMEGDDVDRITLMTLMEDDVDRIMMMTMRWVMM